MTYDVWYVVRASPAAGTGSPIGSVLCGMAVTHAAAAVVKEGSLL